ncbi:ABC transporter substrate-binding protein [Niveispirillum sp.]|uniref:ABC transporter substrate-binding protein n=1 Tax=Niveispirillum sp. TaxID=1917217 RepID=UPI001B48BC2F|nr:ABC transporter substrate-binding protein [Niveispirillum sp.]MBP7335638.1 ABC transporter substrate-binding protein [Niveispirillum sp.]
MSLTRFAARLVAATVLTGLAAIGSVQAADPVVVRAGYIPVLGAAQAFVIDNQGWDLENGFDLQLKQFDSGPNAIQAVASGTLDAYIAGVAPVVVARGKGVGIKVVASTAVEELVVAAGPDLAKTAGSPAQAIEALSKKLGRPLKLATQPAGSVPNTFLQYWLWEVAKVDKQYVELVPQGIDATQQALLVGAVDGAIIREPALTIITGRNKDVKVLAYGQDILKNQPGNVIALTDDFTSKHPDIAQKLVELTARATDVLKKDKKVAVAAIESAIGKGLVPAAIIEQALSSPAVKFNTDPASILKETALVQDYQVKLGTVKEATPVEQIFDLSYYQKLKK